MTALKKVPNICAYAPSRTSTLDMRNHFFRAFHRFATTAGQASFVSVIMLPRYLKAATLVSRRSCALKVLSIPALASSSNNLFRFLSDPFSY